MSEYKEFWNVLFEDGTSEIYVYERAATSQKNAKLITHVIEFSAFEKLQKDWEQAATQNYDDKCEIEKLKKQNEVMREALNFYADESRWKTVEHCELDSKIRIDAEDFDTKTLEPIMIFVGGKRARQALKDAEDVG